jgi:M-phase inducer phosphatase 1
LKGKYDDEIGQYLIIDARYPYEYKGGHIHSAQNSFVEENIRESLFTNPINPTNGKRVVLIFHCEFSSERGPRL